MARAKYRGRFPYFSVILLLIGVFWLLNDLNILIINVPWIPIILIILAVGMIINRYSGK